jgi:hypothetical protein
MIIKIHREIHSYTDNNITTESTYLYKKMTPTVSRPRMFHPNVDTTNPNLNNSVTSSHGYESTRMVPENTWVPKPVISQALIDFSTPKTIQVPNSLIPNLYHPREWTSTLLFHTVP